MKFLLKSVFLVMVAVIIDNGEIIAQEMGASPELEQMYRHAQEYMNLGNFPDAIVTYKQAILLAPDKIVLYTGLGDAFYRSGRYSEAEQVLAPLITKQSADAQCYNLLGASQAAQSKLKEAKVTVQKGLGLFPASGLLYHRLGLIYGLEKRKEDALAEWLNGIAKDPVYPLNYYEAALLYLSADSTGWGILYAETYLGMSHDTSGDQQLKLKLLEGYKAMFQHIAGTNVPEYGHTKKTVLHPRAFIDAVQEVYRQLTPVVSDGITTENLTMVRVRFLMDWFSEWSTQYPFTLFSYQDALIRSGHFDMYSEWVFGNAENTTEYNAWNKFHEGDMGRFISWKVLNPLIPSAADFYYDRNMAFLQKTGKR